ncbi:ATP-binding protein [Sphingomonas panacis]|nr:ATP-binding protein [Sphingomonas panacis]
MQTEQITTRQMPAFRWNEATPARFDLFGANAPTQRVAPPQASTIEIGRQFATLAPVLDRLAGARTKVTLEAGDQALQVRVVPTDFDAAMRDLVAQACAAGADAIVIRARRVGQRIWLLVADTGGATPRSELTRTRAFVHAAHGRLRIHSRPQRGTAISVILPAVLTLAACEPGARIGRLTSKKEKSNAKDRQPVAA